MLEELILVARQGKAAALNSLMAELNRRVLASARQQNRSLVENAERHVSQQGANAFEFDSRGQATLKVAGQSWGAGTFETPTLGELRRLAMERGRRGMTRLVALGGRSDFTDIGALQAFADEGSLFQVASQFNCLEAPDACLRPVFSYFRDPTQGPRAAISAFPATLLRHYAAPSTSGRFRQEEDGQQLNLLEAVCQPGVARVSNGYLMDQNISDMKGFVQSLDTRFDQLRVGVHSNVEVVLGYNFDGAVPSPAPRIHQVLTSTIAGGGYSEGGSDQATFDAICRPLQRAAQLGTLLAAASVGARTAVLTLIGGGVFGNPVPLIWKAIVEAVDELNRLGLALDVVVNGRNLSDDLSEELLDQATQARGGLFIQT